MKISFESDGGFAVFPGLRRPLVVDTDDMPAAAAAELEELVHTARAAVPSRVAEPPAGGADQRSYRITVVDRDGRATTTSYVEPVSGQAAQCLIEHLTALRRDAR